MGDGAGPDLWRVAPRPVVTDAPHPGPVPVAPRPVITDAPHPGPVPVAPPDEGAGANGTGREPPGPPRWEDIGLAAWVEPAYRRVQPVLPLLGVYVLVRLGLLVADVLAAHLTDGARPDGPLLAWDGHWYLSVAATGYPSAAPRLGGHLTYSAAGFEPVFPALIRAVGVLGFTPVQAALAVSFVGGGAAVVLVWRLGGALFDERTASAGALLFAVFPGMAVAWGMLYCECVGLALVAGSLLCMVRGRWVWAGVLGAVATATSPMALPLVLAPAVAVAGDVRRRRPPPALVAVVLVPLGFAAYAGFLALRYHDLLFWWHLQAQAWGARVDGGRSLLRLLVHPWTGGYQGKGWMEWVGLAAAVAGVVALVRARLPAFITAYCVGGFAVMLVSNSIGFKPRFLVWCFPALIGVAALSRRRGWQALVVAFAMILPLVFVAYASFGDYMIQP